MAVLFLVKDLHSSFIKTLHPISGLLCASITTLVPAQPASSLKGAGTKMVTVVGGNLAFLMMYVLVCSITNGLLHASSDSDCANPLLLFMCTPH